MSIQDDIIKGQVDQMLHTASVTGNDELIQKAFSDMIEKGAAANIGEVRIWAGAKYQKEAPGKWKQLGEPEGRVSYGTGYMKPSFSDKPVIVPPVPKIRAERAKLDDNEKVMPKGEYDKTLRSLFTPGEQEGDSYDNARSLWMQYPTLRNRLKKDNPGYSNKELLEQLQYDIEGIMVNEN